MSKFIQLNKRTGETKSHINQARKQGRIPAVLYGIGKDTLSLEVNEKEMLNILKKIRVLFCRGKPPMKKYCRSLFRTSKGKPCQASCYTLTFIM